MLPDTPDLDCGLPLLLEAGVAKVFDTGVCTVFVEIGVCGAPSAALGVTGVLNRSSSAAGVLNSLSAPTAAKFPANMASTTSSCSSACS